MKMKIGSMTLDVLPPVKRYMNAIERRLNTDRKTRTRIMMELASDFQSRRENGQSDEAIMKELGSPGEVAAEFNAAFGAKPAPSRRRWAFVVLAVLVAAAVLGPELGTLFAARRAESIGIIGGADGPTAIYVAAGPAAGFSPLVFLPWLLGCAAGFLLPTWRDPNACRGYAPSLLLSGLGLLPLPVLALLFAVISVADGFHVGDWVSSFPLLLGLSAYCGALLSGIVFCRALYTRRRNRKNAGQDAEKK